MVNDFEVNTIKTLPFNQSKLGNIIHDLESPLTLTLFNLDQLYLKASKYQYDEFVQLLEPAMSGVKEMGSMISSIKSEKDYMPYSINNQITDILRIFANKCKSHDIILKFIPNTDKILYHHKAEFRSIVSNLVSNAVEASLQSNKVIKYIAIITDIEGDHIRLIVRDNADGLPKSIQKKIKVNQLKPNKGIGLVYLNVTQCFKGTIKLTSVEDYGTEYDILLN